MSDLALRIGLIGPLPPPFGGMANQTQQLAELLATGGAHVTVVPVNAPYTPAWIGGVPWVRALFRFMPYLSTLWRAAGRSDVFHIMANSGWSWHLFAAPAVWVARHRGVAVVVNYRGGEAAEFLRGSGRVVRFTLRRACALLVPSGFLQEVFLRHQMQAEILPNIVDLSRFHPREGAPVAGIGGAPHLVVARNLEALYSNETAISAFALVRARFPCARLSIAGSGPEALRLRQMVGALGLDGAVHFCGRLDRDAMAALYRSADLVLNPSLADNMPNSLLEAWASGVPVVSTNVGGIPYLARDGVTASLVPPADPRAMAQAIISLLTDDAVWRSRAQAGLEESKRYTWAQVQPVLMEAYRQAVQRSKHT
jgi:glycosyltransferase involved in cell wall biosynthesis